jgi:hypothetical protein
MSELTMRSQIERLITTCIADKTSPTEIEQVAMSLAEWQIKQIPEYGRFARLSNPKSWVEIPAVPTPIFTAVDFCISATPKVTYLTSGTSTGTRGRHLMPDSEIADLAAKTWFGTLFPSPPKRCLGLVPNPADNPESSLGAMVKALYPETTWTFSNEAGVDVEAAKTEILTKDTPLFIAATALALDDFINGLKEGELDEYHLPAGSILMITGGFKGQRRELGEDELVESSRTLFGACVQIVQEYGMTELSSQLWDVGDGFVAPPWLYVYTVSPSSGEPCDGVGLLRFVDLANYGSCMAIETLDLGSVDGNVVTLKGRLPGSKVRGCSLTAEEASR